MCVFKIVCAISYTDENNRFGDSNITQQFRWHKKEETVQTSRDQRYKPYEQMSERERRRHEDERKRMIEDEVQKVTRCPS